jgi:crotonobetainyl-CoA:carnitine CoA-transferase CaiB-like acyl-CoA transferase
MANQKGDARDGYDKMKAYDMLVQAESGLASVTGSPDAPSRVGVSCCDIASGMAAHAGVCEALFARERHPDKLGEGLAISMFDGMADWMAVPLLFYEEGGVELKRVGLRHPSISPYTTYKAKDGNDVLISIQNEREWQNLCTHVLGDPDLPKDPRFDSNHSRVQNMADTDALVAESFAKHDVDELCALLLKAQVAFGRVSTPSQLGDHPALRRVTVEMPGVGEMTYPAPPIRHISAPPVERLGPVPLLGEQNDQIRTEFSA